MNETPPSSSNPGFVFCHTDGSSELHPKVGRVAGYVIFGPWIWIQTIHNISVAP